ncbi:MAG: hypothetical protein IPJ28_13755 [Betaproteobacteria bacterium]|nr:hypothetical protein [Betaproteobacteria bacterium]
MGEWMETVGPSKWLEHASGDNLALGNGLSVSFRQSVLGEGAGPLLGQIGAARDLVWFEGASTRTQKLPLRVSPSSAKAVDAVIVETVEIGEAMNTAKVKDCARLGDAVHACLAAHVN